MKKRKEQKQEKSSGSGAKRTRPYIFDQQLSFLSKVYTESPNVVDSIIIDGDVDSIEIDEDVDSIEKDNTLDDISSGVRKPATERKRKLPVRNEVDHKMMKFIDHQMGATSKANEENHYLDFFKSLVPSVRKFDDDQFLEFQGGVIALIQKIRNKT